MPSSYPETPSGGDEKLHAKHVLAGRNGGGREGPAALDSPCFAENGNFACLSCHSMHKSAPDDQLRAGMRTNEVCLQCHQDYRTKLSDQRWQQMTHEHVADPSLLLGPAGRLDKQRITAMLSKRDNTPVYISE